MTKIIITMLAGCLSATSAFAAHPLASDDAATLGKGAVQVELNGDILYDRESDSGTTTKNRGAQIATAIGVGLTDKLDLTLGAARPWGELDVNGECLNNTGTMNIDLSMKWQIYEQQGFSVAVKPGLGYSYAVHSPVNEHVTSYGAALIFSKEFRALALHLDTGYAYCDYNLAETRIVNRSSTWSFSLASTYELIKDLKLATDLGFATNTDKTSNNMPAFALVGAIYSVNESIDLSAGIKTGLTKPETDLAGTFGITYKF